MKPVAGQKLGEDSRLTARPAAAALRTSLIREVANAGEGQKDVLAFWFGEPDEVTPEFISRAATEALAAGETFYTHNLGLAPLRDAIAAYVSRLHRPIGLDHVAVTSSGMAALMVVTQALVGPGDRVVTLTPCWPNVVETPKVLGAQVTCVPLVFGSGWKLDLDQLLDALTPGTVALYLNSPNNPTGWSLEPAERDAILAHCRKHGIWIISDDAYERLYYGAASANHVAPSFLDSADPDERVISANTFSKAWLMTGWRLGWMVAPRGLMPDFGKLIEYSTSCAPGFVQRGGIVALTEGEPVVTRTRERFRRARDFLVERLNRIPRVTAPLPEGAMYAFFRVDGVGDTLAFCKRLVAEHGLGLAPGSAFGPEGDAFVRWCFAATEDRLERGVERLAEALG